jgi:hypothetical protein
MTIDLDPPLVIPPLGRATFEGSFDSQFVSVKVWDRDENCVAYGKYVRVDPSSNRFTLLSGQLERAGCSSIGRGARMSVEFTNEGTGGHWLREDRLLKLTVFEVGWLWAILIGLHDKDGERWPTAKPDENGKPIPTTIPKRIAEKLMDLMA